MENPRHWRLKAQRYRLEGSTCRVCGRLIFPPRPACPQCTTQPELITGRGFQVLPAATGLTGIASNIGIRITERITG